MLNIYSAHDRLKTVEAGITSAETFFGSAEEKYLGFGNLVQFSRLTIGSAYGSTAMVLHRNEEIVDVIMKGAAGYQDSAGTTAVFPEQSLQVCSAGKGMYQRVFAAGIGETEIVRIGFLPSSLNTTPIKTKGMFALERNRNRLMALVSPGDASTLSIRQQGAVFLGAFDAGQHLGYTLNNPLTGVFLHVFSGKVVLHNNFLHEGDSAGIFDEEQMFFHTTDSSIVMLIEVSRNN